MQQQAVTSAPTPAPPVQVTVDGAAISSPSAVYQAFRAQRRELGRQLDDLQNSRNRLSELLLNTPATSTADRKGLEERITSVDARIAAVDKQIAESDAQVARTAAIPGAAADPPEPPRTGPPEEVYVLGAIFMFVFLLPMSIAYARRIWRRSAQVVTSIPRDVADRLMRVEQTVEASAIEIERIGEGQRFMTRVLTEGQAAQPLPLQQRAAAQIKGGPGE